MSGMPSEEVQQLLEKPDQIHPLYEPRKRNPRKIGTRWFYMRTPKSGSQRTDTEIAVRFDLMGKVTRVDSWGLDE